MVGDVANGRRVAGAGDVPEDAAPAAFGPGAVMADGRPTGAPNAPHGAPYSNGAAHGNGAPYGQPGDPELVMEQSRARRRAAESAAAAA
ncbi:hypothetical protein ACFPFQ_10275, partial [Pseudonocardia sp. GCM10023141]